MSCSEDGDRKCIYSRPVHRVCQGATAEEDSGEFQALSTEGDSNSQGGGREGGKAAQSIGCRTHVWMLAGCSFFSPMLAQAALAC